MKQILIAAVIAVFVLSAGTTGAQTIVLTPIPQNIQIPLAGGSFQYQAVITNNTLNTITFDAWTEAMLPNLNMVGPLLYVPNITLGPNQTITATLTQYVPGYAPAGGYAYWGNVGVYPTYVDRYGFDFVKLPNGPYLGFGPEQNWKIEGWKTGSAGE